MSDNPNKMSRTERYGVTATILSSFIILVVAIVSNVRYWDVETRLNDRINRVETRLTDSIKGVETRLTNVIKDDKTELKQLIANTNKAVDKTDKMVRENTRAIRELTAIAHETLGNLNGLSRDK